MAIQTLDCKRCDKPFKAPNFLCADGKRHQVEPKTYYAAHANLNTVVSPERIIQVGGDGRMIAARLVEFHRGAFTTSDPEDQIALDDLFSKGGLLTAEQWQERYISKDERLAMQSRNLAQREASLKERENALLTQIQAQVKASEPEDNKVTAEK